MFAALSFRKDSEATVGCGYRAINARRPTVFYELLTSRISHLCATLPIPADFVALCKAGCVIDEYITYEYLAHPPAAVGTVMLARDEYTEPGSYVLRYTCGGDYSVAGESAPFQVLEEGCSTFRSMDYAEIFPQTMKS
ncbi:hypothetical protein AB1Y20_014089 [Prymnesium parvum]|uniref:Uncharacterized protein n=1 Tax=Prymnesium parvum TaxID=97485 RepID=A0AB34IIC1_PRYPA